jgi:thiopeptide-type bacteriocin biosynthesis protein
MSIAPVGCDIIGCPATCSPSGSASLDDVLVTVGPLLAALEAAGRVERWFFIRYADPHTHLRLRVSGEPHVLLGQVLPDLERALRPLVESGIVWRVQTDTYERETERYGGPCGIELAEELFGVDSNAVLTLVTELRAMHMPHARWMLSLASVDDLLAQFASATAARKALLDGPCAGLRQEINPRKQATIRIGNRFRSLRASLRELIVDREAVRRRFGAVTAHALARRAQDTARIAARFRQAEAAGRLTLPVDAIVPSLVHMHVNRLLKGAHRVQEYVIYDFLLRLYHENIARESSRPADMSGSRSVLSALAVETDDTPHVVEIG